MIKEFTDLETIKKWLVEGKDKPETFVDLRWEVLVEKKDEDGSLKVLRVTHPKIPINLLVLKMVDESSSIKAVRLVIETGIKTIDLETREKLNLYRLLLDASKLPLVKFYIFGDEHEIAIASDLDLRLLTKAEFAEALGVLLLSYLAVVRTLIDKYKAEIEAEELEVLYALVSKWYVSGVKREDALKKLVDAGIDKETAEKLIDYIYKGSSKTMGPLFI